jgi:hypothetical protein
MLEVVGLVKKIVQPELVEQHQQVEGEVSVELLVQLHLELVETVP